MYEKPIANPRQNATSSPKINLKSSNNKISPPISQQELDMTSSTMAWGPQGYTPPDKMGTVVDEQILIPGISEKKEEVQIPTKVSKGRIVQEISPKKVATELTKNALFGTKDNQHTVPSTIKKIKNENETSLMDFEPTSTTSQPVLSPSESSGKFTRILEGKEGNDVTDFETVPSVQRILQIPERGVVTGSMTDLTMKIFTIKLYEKECLRMALFVSNVSEAGDMIKDAKISWDSPSHIALESEDVIMENHEMNIADIPPQKALVIFFKLKLSKYGSHANIRGNFTYKLNGSGQPRLLVSTTAILVHDFLRGASMQADTFFGLWAQHNVEKKMVLAANSEKFSEDLPDMLRMSLIDKDKEGSILMAGKVLNNGLCLCSAKVRGNTAEISVRTRDPALVQSFVNDSSRIIQK